MKLFKKNTCSKKSNNNSDGINFLIVFSCSLTTVGISLVLRTYSATAGALGALGELAPKYAAYYPTKMGQAEDIADTDTEINTPVLFRPPPESERPENTEGAASRGGTSDQYRECPQDFFVFRQQEFLGDREGSGGGRNRLSLTAIVPDRNYGLTVAERPNFWFYLPKTSARQAILSIKEEGNNPHWQQSINLKGETGIIGIKLSDDAPALEIGKNYQWAIILVCGNKPNPNDPFVTAWIKRVDESINNSSQGERRRLPPTGLEKANVYAQKGIWYDALDILIAERKSSWDNWSELWMKYLQSAGLEQIANKPVVKEGAYKLLKKH